MKCNTPINNFIDEYAASGMSRFHMPGHKGAGDIEIRDITEINGADYLYAPSGIIEESERIAGKIFGTEATYFSVEGSSQCIKAMLALVTKWSDEENRTILAARNVHSAFLSAAALLDLDVEWLYPEDEEYSLCRCSISAKQIEDKLASMEQKPAAIYVTSPDYLGNIADIGEIAQTAHKNGVPLLVDNAHGAYLKFIEGKNHPMELGADMCCDSAHKTLPALTGCAYLHIGNKKYVSNARKALMLFGSTSPSFVLLASLDRLNEVLDTAFARSLAKHLQKVSECREYIESLGFAMSGNEPMKLVINTKKSGLKGCSLAGLLRKQKIECEYEDPDFLVLMPSPYNTDEDFERLKEALKNAEVKPYLQNNTESFKAPRPQKAMSIRKAAFAESEMIKAEDAAGRILAQNTVSCPPAVPIVISGEIIPQEAVRIFKYYDIDMVSVVME